MRENIGDWLRQRLLIVVAAVALLAYHAYSFLHRDEYLVGFRWRPSAITLAWRTRAVLLSTPSATKNLSGAIDAAAARLTSFGGIARFLAGEVREYALAGESLPFRWMFVRGEAVFQYAPAAGWVDTHYLRPLRPLLARLDAEGVKAVVVPVPTKMAIERRHLAGPRPSADWVALPPGPPSPAAGYAEMIAALPRVAVDLYTPFDAFQSAHPDDLLYDPMGTHWTSHGAALAVTAIVDKLRADGEAYRTVEPAFVDLPARAAESEFAHLLALPPWYVAGNPAFAWREPRFRLPDASLRRRPGRVVLVGSSYTDSPRISPFRELLAQALGTAPEVYSESGDHYALGTLARAAAAPPRRGDLFIFEFPYRFPWEAGTVLPEVLPPVVGRDVATVNPN